MVRRCGSESRLEVLIDPGFLQRGLSDSGGSTAAGDDDNGFEARRFVTLLKLFDVVDHGLVRVSIQPWSPSRAHEVAAERRIDLGLARSAYEKVREMTHKLVEKARHLARLRWQIGHRPHVERDAKREAEHEAQRQVYQQSRGFGLSV